MGTQRGFLPSGQRRLQSPPGSWPRPLCTCERPRAWPGGPLSPLIPRDFLGQGPCGWQQSRPQQLSLEAHPLGALRRQPLLMKCVQ